MDVAGAGCAAVVEGRMFLTHDGIGSAIIRFAAEQHSDAVVLARRSHMEPGRAQVLRVVLDESPCPVLLVGEPAAELQITP
jgi:nucleotide-binding universal stress UspA family protein